MSQVLNDDELTSCLKKASYSTEPVQPTPLKGTGWMDLWTTTMAMTGSCNVGSQKQTREIAIDFGNFFHEM
jgi:hypothetical protein